MRWHISSHPVLLIMFMKPQDSHEPRSRYEDGPRNPAWSWVGIFFVLGALWLILSLIGCSASRKEYVVDYTRGNDITAKGSRARPCQTEVQCRMLADREGVRSYWMVYQ